MGGKEKGQRRISGSGRWGKGRERGRDVRDTGVVVLKRENQPQHLLPARRKKSERDVHGKKDRTTGRIRSANRKRKAAQAVRLP